MPSKCQSPALLYTSCRDSLLGFDYFKALRQNYGQHPYELYPRRCCFGRTHGVRDRLRRWDPSDRELELVKSARQPERWRVLDSQFVVAPVGFQMFTWPPVKTLAASSAVNPRIGPGTGVNDIPGLQTSAPEEIRTPNLSDP